MKKGRAETSRANHKEKIGIKYQIDSPPNVTINASKDGIESEKFDHEPGSDEPSSESEPETDQEHVVKKSISNIRMTYFPT